MIPHGSEVLVDGPAGLTKDVLLAAPSSLKTLVFPFAGVPPSVIQALQDPALADRRFRLYGLHHNASATAEIAVALLLAAARRVVLADKAVRSADWRLRHTAGSAGAVQLTGRRALVLGGAGAVGRRVCAVLEALGMSVSITRSSHSRKELKKEHDKANDAMPGAPAPAGTGTAVQALGGPEDQLQLQQQQQDRVAHPSDKATLLRLLPAADVLVVCTPLTPLTRHLIGAHELSLLPRGAVVVNVGRAEVIQEDAMWHALKEDGGLSLSFGSDVWWQESLNATDGVLPSSRHAFSGLDNVVLTPHFGGAPGLPGMEDARADSLVELLRLGAKEEWPRAVDVELGY
jgi:phosphoglycerate dehydrogenase-like enzyme